MDCGAPNKTHRYLFTIIFLAIFSCSTRNVDPYNRVGSVPETRYVPVYVPQRNYPTNYRPYARPNSRAYRNPYSYQPRTYSPYYDLDEYYVPPSGYYSNPEPDHAIDPNVKY